jgi:hypothetical protein
MGAEQVRHVIAFAGADSFTRIARVVSAIDWRSSNSHFRERLFRIAASSNRTNANSIIIEEGKK